MLDPSNKFNGSQSVLPDMNSVPDNADSNFPPSILRVGVAGDLVVVNLAGIAVPIYNCQPGEYVRGLAIGVRATANGVTSTATGVTRYA